MSDSSVDSFQASPQQEYLWAMEADGPTARTQAVLRVDGEVQLGAVAEALRAALATHESLRTTFVHQPGLRLPLQAVHAQLDAEVELLDLAPGDPTEHAEQLELLARAAFERPFDFEHGPLVRATIATDGPSRTTLILTLSALCADAASTSLLLGEIASRLTGASTVGDPLQYADFSAWQHELGASEEDEAKAARSFWADLDGARSPQPPFARAAGETVTAQARPIAVDDGLADALAAQASRYGTVPAALVQAAWHSVLGRFSGEQATTVAFVAGERRHPDLAGAIGAFTRPVPIAARVDPTRAFAEVLSEIDRARGDALVRQDYAPRGAFEGIDIGFIEYPAGLPQAEGLGFSLQSMLHASPDLGLALMCATDGNRLALSIAFDPARHPEVSIDALAEGLARTLSAAAADPGCALADIPLLGEEESRRLLQELNDTAAEVAPQRVHELVADWARSAPERQAVIDGDGSISYAELDARANQLAHVLLARGAGPDVGVGLCTDRSLNMIVGLLGILKSGAAYVPLHHEHPPARLKHQLATAGAVALVTQESLLDKLGGFEGEVLCLDRDRDQLEREPVVAPDIAVAEEQLAYVIFTSGSTGTPKGVSVTHANLANYAADIVRRLDATEQAMSFGLVTSISTDLGNTSVFGALCSGGTLVLIPPGAAADPGALARFMEATPVDVLKITPSHVGALLAGDDARVLPRRWLVLGGERAGWDLIDRVRALSSCAILNHYGPTETTVGSCTFPVTDGPGEYQPASVPIGRPISNTRCYVLDDARRPLPVGVAGRLFIAGAGVARGYAGDPELTAERFASDPFVADGAGRMYDTGDLARWLPDGAIEFLGRVDEQLKIRGYRVEPAEVEAALRSHPQVLEAVTATQSSGTGELRLVAYCTVEGTVEEGRLRAHLAEWLPEFMLPGAIVLVEEFPRTPSGKIDKQQLPDPDLAGTQSAAYLAPRTPLEEALCAIWADVLGVAQVGVEDDFFALGGHSLLATQVVAQVRSDFAVDLPLHSLFTCPTIAALAEEIVRMMGDSEVDDIAGLMSELEGMSDEEAERLLAEDLPPETGRR